MEPGLITLQCNRRGRVALSLGRLDKEDAMRIRIATIAFISACIAVPLGAMAQTVGLGPPAISGPLSVDQARDIAVMNGVIAIRKIELYDGTWHVEGRDDAGRRVEMQIDPGSGEVAHLERFH